VTIRTLARWIDQLGLVARLLEIEATAVRQGWHHSGVQQATDGTRVGALGHGKRGLRSAALDSVRGTKGGRPKGSGRCSVCGEAGHNRTSCPKRAAA